MTEARIPNGDMSEGFDALKKFLDSIKTPYKSIILLESFIVISSS